MICVIARFSDIICFRYPEASVVWRDSTSHQLQFCLGEQGSKWVIERLLKGQEKEKNQVKVPMS